MPKVNTHLFPQILTPPAMDPDSTGWKRFGHIVVRSRSS